MAHFGAPNQRLDVAGHALVLVDSLGLVAEDTARRRAGLALDQWRPEVEDSAFAFVREVAANRSVGNGERSNFSRFPLFTSPYASCCCILLVGVVAAVG
jgi:hypothetical protein